ncbi:hypothetical protein [Methanobrevibacter sp.]|uniref:hypothetical protein n=1 Tax=Methanobrevibacter sp. TaxID=66852 RepID=UPI0025E0610B|nr:hypothetical protein [Methanobrevibacter sp.]MBR4446845.1 hypothetical protein [Methanobrevibacter sp.]
MGDKISYNDVREYEDLFKLAPAFLLERFAKKNSNIVLKFKSQILSHISDLDDTQKKKLDLILRTDISVLQAVMKEAYIKTKIKQYKILANPKYHGFIEKNLNELRKLI